MALPLSTELTVLKNAPLDFVKHNWIAPASGYGALFGTANGYLPLARVMQGNVGTMDSLLTITSNRDKVAYGKLSSESSNKYKLDFYSHRQLNPGQRADYLPMWFLPWFSDHVTKMKILQRGLLPPGVPDPDVFFTSALSGCSVFVEGPANAPTVFHGGFSNVRDFTAQPRIQDPATNVEADSLQHWRLLFDQYSPGSRALPQNVAEVNKTQYLSGGGAWSAMTPDMQAYKLFLATEHKDQMRVEDIKSEGTVMGIRAGDGNWTFYLQESVTVTVYMLRKRKKLLGKSRLVDGEQRTYTRPMVVRQIYPVGAQAVHWNMTRVVA